MAELEVLNSYAWRDVVIITIALLASAAAPALGATVTQAPTISGDPAPGNTADRHDRRAGRRPARRRPTAGCAVATPEIVRADQRRLRSPLQGPDGRCGTHAARPAHGDGLRPADGLRRLRPHRRSSPTTPTRPVVGASDTCIEVTPTGPGQGTFISGEQTGSGHDARRRTPRSPSSTPSRSCGSRALHAQAHEAHARDGQRSPWGPHPGELQGAAAPTAQGHRREARPVPQAAAQLPANATIEIRVTQPQKIGKYTRVKTRKGKAPLRIDRCLMPGRTRPVTCPTA